MYRGFLITKNPIKYNGILYSGVETDPFPLEIGDLTKTVGEQCATELMRKLNNWNEPVVLLNTSEAKEYYKACTKMRMSVRLLYVDAHPHEGELDPMNDIINKFNLKWLGYDVAECSSDFYSAIPTDIILRPHIVEMSFAQRLNKHGLFSNITDAEQFLKAREKSKLYAEDMTFECDECQIISVYTANPNSLAFET